MIRVALCLLLVVGASRVWAQSADREFLLIYGLIQEGENLERSGQGAEASDRFRAAQRDLERFSKANASWNPKIVKFRLEYLAEKIAAAPVPPSAPLATETSGAESLAGTSGESAPPTGSALEHITRAEARAKAAETRADLAHARANVAEDRNSRLALELRAARDRVDVLQVAHQTLEANRAQLELERSTLESKLKEALGPKPASLNPAELSRAHERNLLLVKENEILKASLDQLTAENQRLVEKAGKALELERQLGLARAEVSTLRRENDDLRSERQKLVARVEGLGRKLDPAATLRNEIETLKKELAATRTAPAEPASDVMAELNRLREELAESRSAAAALRSDNATLTREVEKLSVIQVNPASLKAAEVPPQEFAAVDLQKVRRLELERDGLRVALAEARQALQQEKARQVSGLAETGVLNRRVESLEARIASLEASTEPFTPEELALFRAPTQPIDLARNPLVSGGAGPTPVQVAQASAPTPAGSGPNTPPGDGKAPLSTNAPASGGTAAPAAGSTSASGAGGAGASRRRTMRDLPSGAGGLAAQAQRAFMQRRFDEAEKAYREILTMDERNVFTLGNLAAILVERGRIEEGEGLLKRALEADPQDPFSLSLQGIIRFRQQKYDEAFDALSRSAQLDPDNADTQNYLGITLSQRGQRKAAEAALRKALKLNPSSPAAHYNLAVVYATQKPPFLELAKYHYDKARRSGQPANPAFEGVLRGEPAEPAKP